MISYTFCPIFAPALLFVVKIENKKVKRYIDCACKSVEWDKMLVPAYCHMTEHRAFICYDPLTFLKSS